MNVHKIPQIVLVSTVCYTLTLSMSGCRQHLKYIFSHFSQKIGFAISWKLSSYETICLKYQAKFLGKLRKNIISLSSAEFVQGVVKIKGTGYTFMFYKGDIFYKFLFTFPSEKGSALKGKKMLLT